MSDDIIGELKDHITDQTRVIQRLLDPFQNTLHYNFRVSVDEPLKLQPEVLTPSITVEDVQVGVDKWSVNVRVNNQPLELQSEVLPPSVTVADPQFDMDKLSINIQGNDQPLELQPEILPPSVTVEDLHIDMGIWRANVDYHIRVVISRKILIDLWFPDINLREERIHETYADTYQ
jgi:hypothetical protein